MKKSTYTIFALWSKRKQLKTPISEIYSVQESAKNGGVQKTVQKNHCSILQSSPLEDNFPDLAQEWRKGPRIEGRRWCRTRWQDFPRSSRRQEALFVVVQTCPLATVPQKKLGWVILRYKSSTPTFGALLADLCHLYWILCNSVLIF